MVALPAAAIERDALPAMAVAQFTQARRNLGDRHVPPDLFEAALRAPAQRRGEAIAMMGIEGNASRLVAEITFRFQIVAVAANLADALAFDQHLDAAIDVAEI